MEDHRRDAKSAAKQGEDRAAEDSRTPKPSGGILAVVSPLCVLRVSAVSIENCCAPCASSQSRANFLSMNPDVPKNPREELEARLTAFILGELPAEQAFSLGQAIEKDAELARLYNRLKQTVELVRETETSPAQEAPAQVTPLKLSEQSRQKLLQHFKTVAPKEFAEPRRRRMTLMEVAAVIAIAGLLVSIAIPNFVKT